MRNMALASAGGILIAGFAFFPRGQEPATEVPGRPGTQAIVQDTTRWIPLAFGLFDFNQNQINRSFRTSYVSVFREYGPTGRGWKSAVLFTNWGEQWCETDWSRSRGFSRRSAMLYRPHAANRPDTAALGIQIRGASAHNAHWVLLDDALTGWIVDSTAPVRKSTMDWIASRAHARGMLVAAAEDYESVFAHGAIQSHWALYENVDIIMPYGYDREVRDLERFYAWIAKQGKKVVPVLGYHVRKGDHWYSQTGSRSGDRPFIEGAVSYALDSLVLYYIEPDQGSAWDGRGGSGSYLDRLDSYLHRYRYLPPGR